MPPRPDRRRRSDTESVDTELVEFVSEWGPVDQSVERVRIGRPDYGNLYAGSNGAKPEDTGPILYEFTSEALPPGEAYPDRIRLGRPERSPSLPPPEDDSGPTPPG